jgi:hypothetical protein
MKKFNPVVSPRLNLSPRSDNKLVKGVFDRLNELLQRVFDRFTAQINDTINSLVARLNENCPIWAHGEVVEIHIDAGNPEFNPNKDLAVRHNLGTIPRYFIILQAKPTRPIYPAAPPGNYVWDGDDEPALTACPDGSSWYSPWTDTHVYFRMNTVARQYRFKFKVLLLP